MTLIPWHNIYHQNVYIEQFNISYVLHQHFKMWNALQGQFFVAL